MSTIQQQLAALGPTFEVDGQKWEVKEQNIIYKNWPIAIELLLVGSDGQGGGKYYQYPSLFGQLFPTKFTKSIDAPTPADACRQALAICRERVAELAGALGMGVYNEIKEKADKWDALDEQVGKYYEPEPDGGQGFVNEYQLDTIGEICATHLGYM